MWTLSHFKGAEKSEDVVNAPPPTSLFFNKKVDSWQFSLFSQNNPSRVASWIVKSEAEKERKRKKRGSKNPPPQRQ